MNSYTKHQIKETKKHFNTLLKDMQYISFSDLNKLYNQIGLHLKPNDKYYNNLNYGFQYFAYNIDILDDDNMHCFNVNSDWYKTNISKTANDNKPNYTPLYYRLRELQKMYITKKGNYICDL